MAKKKFYAVLRGRTPGIYNNWPDCQKQVSGFPNAKYQSFKNIKDAQRFMNPGVKPKANKTLPQGMLDGDNLDLNSCDYVLYTDGGCRNHGNIKNGHVRSDDKAAWAYRIDKIENGKAVGATAGTKGYYGRTNNAMELSAVAAGLTRLGRLGLSNSRITLVADSRYVLGGLTQGWLNNWENRGYKKGLEDIPNKDLWQYIQNTRKHFPHLKYAWTKGHNLNKGNNYVDGLLNKTMDKMPAEPPLPHADISGIKHIDNPQEELGN